MGNYCRSCNEDFGSVKAFDMHRVGVHDYTFAEGLDFNPPVEDGRRCLDLNELRSVTDRSGAVLFARNAHGTWSLRSSLESARKFSTDEIGLP